MQGMCMNMETSLRSCFIYCCLFCVQEHSFEEKKCDSKIFLKLNSNGYVHFKWNTIFTLQHFHIISLIHINEEMQHSNRFPLFFFFVFLTFTVWKLVCKYYLHSPAFSLFMLINRWSPLWSLNHISLRVEGAMAFLLHFFRSVHPEHIHLDHGLWC